MSNELKNLHQKLAELETENDRLKKSLQQSEEWFRKVFHAASNMMAIHTIKERRFIDVNEAAASLGGFKREELIGHTMKEYNLMGDSHFEEIVNRKLREEGKVRNIEAKMRTKEGGMRTVLASIDPITINNEPCLLAVSVDITEREEKADALRHSEEKYRMLVENSLQGLAIIQSLRFVFCNTTFAVIWGYSLKELLALTPDEVDAMIHPDDRLILRERVQNQLAGNPVDSRFEFRGIRKDGKTIWLEENTCVVEYGGMPCIQAVCMDITERKLAENALRESEERFRLIAESIDEIFWMFDVEKGVNTYLSPAYDRISGFSRNRAPGEPEPFMDPIHPDDREQMFTAMKNLTAGLPFNHEFRIIRNDGSVRNIWDRGFPVKDKEGKLIRYVGVGQDITEYKRLEEQLLQSQKMEAIGVLAGGVAHDFNNLLNVINGYTELILEDLETDNPLRKDIEQVLDAGQRAAALTSQLLAFGRKQIMQLEIFDINQIIVNMSSLLRRMIGEDVELVCNTQPGPIMVNADPAKIQQVIMNLVVNARDAMPHGGKLTIETANIDFEESYIKDHPVTKPGPYVMMAISDNGIGMNQATQAHIFEPFFTTKGKEKGTGLGLSTVYGVVKQSNGFIWVYSEPGKGTTFKIYLPREKDAVVIAPAENKSVAGLLGNETVLIVEDEKAVRTFTARVLRDRGYNILEAANSVEAFQIEQEYRKEIHLILTDVVMPGMGGKVLVSRFEQIRPGIKSMYISGYTDNAIVHQGILDSGVAFLQKPFTIDGLIRKVREVLGR